MLRSCVFLLLGLGALSAFTVSMAQVQQHGSVALIKAVAFDADGCSLISGWYWVRPGCRQYADWLFPMPPLKEMASDLYINFGPLVSNDFNGGSGWETTVCIEVFLIVDPAEALGIERPEGIMIWSDKVYLHNPFRPQIKEYTYGVGYQAFADGIRIDKDYLLKAPPQTRYLLVRVRRVLPEHVGVNQDCLYLAFKKVEG